VSIDARAVLKEVDALESQIQNGQRVLEAMKSKGATLQVMTLRSIGGGVLNIPSGLLPAVIKAVDDQIGEWVAEARRLENSVQVVK